MPHLLLVVLNMLKELFGKFRKVVLVLDGCWLEFWRICTCKGPVNAPHNAFGIDDEVPWSNIVVREDKC